MFNTAVVLTSAVVVSLVIGVKAQTPGGGASSAPQSPASPNTAEDRKVNLHGCVFPKRALSSAERVVVVPDGREDFIVTDTKVISASPGLDKLDGRVFKLNGVEPERLRQLNGKRAGVSARLDDKAEMGELNVISILENVGGCPPVPSSKPDR